MLKIIHMTLVRWSFKHDVSYCIKDPDINRSIMADHVSKSKRSEMMALVPSKDSTTEFLVRQMLHRFGFRYRLHKKDLPGSPDLVLGKYRAAVFVHGCFWHGHRCILSKRLPKTKTEFWATKISNNIARDVRTQRALVELGWRICIIWECALKRQQRLSTEEILEKFCLWLKGNEINLEISGRPSRLNPDRIE